MGTKNNPSNRGLKKQSVLFNDIVVVPAMMVGKDAGFGIYMIAVYENGDPVEDENGNPVAWDSVS